jgi:fructose-bisphosphate aldolase, class I
MDDLACTAAALVAPGQGILATGESIQAISARLTAAGVTPTEQSRGAYREMLIATPGLSQGISGVLLADETLHRHLADGRLFPVAIGAAGMRTGIKADGRTWPLAGAPGETVTEGLDGLPQRLRAYAGLGATSPAGEPCSGSATERRPRSPFRPMPRRSGGSPPPASRPGWCR